MAQDLLKEAEAAYTNLRRYFLPGQDPPLTNYWQIGNCFDTMTDFLLAASPTFTDSGLPGLAQARLNDPAVQKAACWYDDYAWWGIASAKAYDSRFAGIFGDYARAFTGIAQNCWALMDQGKGDGVHLGAPQAFANRDNQTMFTRPPTVADYWVTPFFDDGPGSGIHGVWQYDIFANQRAAPNWYGPPECNKDTNPSWPTGGCRIGPFQLTVVNGLYFLFAQRLEQAHRADHGIPSAALQLADEYGFLRAWFGWPRDRADGISAQDSLLITFPDDGGRLVRERVSIYRPRNGTRTPVEWWTAERRWAGDQGLILNALAGYRQMFRDDHVATALIPRLINGFIDHMVDDGVPQAYYPNPDPDIFDHDVGDYKCGTGVFLRGLLQAYQTGDHLVRDIAKSSKFQQFLTDCVTWAKAIPQNDHFDSLNVLAALTAALVMQRQ